jgi:predicted dehydrogenase
MSTQGGGRPLNNPDVPATKRKIRVGIVGCGEAAQIIHWPSLNHLANYYEVTALCDVSPRVLEELGKRWNIQYLTTDHRELVTRSQVDAVLVANPNAFHSEVTLNAITAGKHVLVEKPMCVTRREADEIVAAQKGHKVVVQVGYMRRYAPAFLQGCALVKQMGPVKFARVHDLIGSNALIINATSRVVRDEHMPKAVKKAAKAREETLFEEALGGKLTADLKKAYAIMLGLSSHDVSAMREILGLPKGVLFAACRGRAGPGDVGIYLAAAFDYGPYICQFETGIDRIARFAAYLEVYGEERVVRVQYDTPYVRNSPVRLVVTEANRHGGVTELNAHPGWGDPFVEEWKAFYQNVTENKAPKTSPADFIQDLELFAEMIRQMRES